MDAHAWGRDKGIARFCEDCMHVARQNMPEKCLGHFCWDHLMLHDIAQCKVRGVCDGASLNML